MIVTALWKETIPDTVQPKLHWWLHDDQPETGGDNDSAEEEELNQVLKPTEPERV